VVKIAAVRVIDEFRWDEQALPQGPDGGHGAPAEPDTAVLVAAVDLGAWPAEIRYAGRDRKGQPAATNDHVRGPAVETA
jgi:hypothetical protein